MVFSRKSTIILVLYKGNTLFLIFKLILFTNLFYLGHNKIKISKILKLIFSKNRKIIIEILIRD